MTKVYIIAEAGVNHNGSVDTALELIDAAVKAGANAVKFQTYKTEKLVTQFAKKAHYQIDKSSLSESQFDMLKKYELNENDFIKLQQYCQESNIDFMSTPFDPDSADFLIHQCGLKKIKISSGDLTNAPLLLKIARDKCEVILSTGMAVMDEIQMALGVLAFGYTSHDKNPSREEFKLAYESLRNKRMLHDLVSILQCTSAYPTDYKDVNLSGMDSIKEAFGCPVGLSDHTQGYHIALAAVARGATIIEKHFTLDKNMPGPDHKASLEPYELYQMVNQIREIELAIGNGTKQPSLAEAANLLASRKSIVANCDIKVGDVLTESNICIKRPGDGINPCYFWDYIGKESKHAYQQGEVLKP